MAGNFSDSNCRVVPTKINATTPVTCLTAQGYTQVISVRIANTHASATPVIALIYKPVADGVSYFYQANYTLPVGSALWFDFNAFGLYQNDQILVQSSIANAVDTFVTVVEIPGRSQ